MKTLQPIASVIVPVYNGMPSLAAQLEALLNQNFAGPWEIVYADNGSSDGSKAYIQERAAQSRVPIRLIDASAKKGQVYARNLGAKEAYADILVFHDQDDLAAPSWLAELVKALEAGDAVGGFVHVTKPGEPASLAAIGQPSADLPVLTGRFRTALGTNFGIHRRVFEAIGGWKDIGVFAGEDTDLCARLETKGYNLSYAPKAQVVWRARQEANGVFKQGMTYGRADVMIYLLWRDGGAERPSWLNVLRYWKRSAFGFLSNPFSRSNRLVQLHRFGWSCGRVAEGYKQGVLWPRLFRAKKSVSPSVRSQP